MPDTLVDLLRDRAQSAPGATGYVYLVDGEAQEARLTYGELDGLARAAGARLQELGAAGERVAILEPAGLGFVAAFFGCLYAGAVPVPLLPADSERGRRRLASVLADASPAFALAPPEILAALAPGASGAGAGLRGLAVAEVPGELAGSWRDPGLRPDDSALLQYTSGSTAAPRGVRLTHANVLHNQEAIRQAFGHTKESVLVGWLPLYHDMGLLGNLLSPLYLGFPCILLSPLDVLARPARWLRAVSRYRATTSGGPNSAFDLCVRKIVPEELQGCDLSSWQVAYNGSEPVRAETLERFAGAFAPYGFRREALHPCYGLAEATLIVAGGPPGRAPVVRWVDARSLEAGQAVELPGPGSEARALVSCGRSLAGQRLEIVDPASGVPCRPGEVGEIWAAGPSVAAGYWGHAAGTGVFDGRLAPGGEGPFLRTGDLGFLLAGELFVTGRQKDLIIVRGRNLYPQDVERTVESCDPAVRAGGVAAFPLEVDGEETVGLACEVNAAGPAAPERRFPELLASIGRAVAAAHGVTPSAIALLAPRTLFKTSSGKLQRRLCRSALQDGSLPVLSLWREPAAGGSPASPPGELADWIAARVAGWTGVPAAALDPARPLSSYGLDSLRLADLVAAIEDRSGVRLPWSSLLADPSAAALAGAVRAPRPAAPAGEFLPARENRLVLALSRAPVRHLFRRHFHAVWLDRGYAPRDESARTVYFLNHSSWWDTLIPALLNQLVFRQRARYMMSHPLMAHRWYYRRLFQAMGVFSVASDSPALRAVALRYAAELLDREGTALYVYPQGKTQPESGEIRFQEGIGWLHARCPKVDFVPVACLLHTMRTARPQLYLKVGGPVALATPPGAGGRARLLEARCRELLGELRTVAHDPLRPEAEKGFTRLL